MNSESTSKRQQELAQKWLDGSITPAEEEEYNRWYHAPLNEPVDIEEGFAKNEETLRNRILWKVQQKSGIKRYKNNGSKKLLGWLSAAAIITIAFGGAFHFLSNKENYPIATVKNEAYKNDVLPGTQKATLTISNGKQINLNNASIGTIAIQGGSKVEKSKNGEIVYQNNNPKSNNTCFLNTLSTPIGGQYQLHLPDGTKVWLNAGSSITYPTSFIGNTRKVSITGEAYFEVSKNAAKPFIVTYNNMTITVLGTHFNISSYTDDPTINTTLLEGSVKVTNTKSGESLFIKPGQQSRLDKSGHIDITKANTEEAISWKEGLFQFNKTEIKKLMREVARWYNLNIVYKGPVTKDLFTGTIPMNLQLTELLSILQDANIHFKLEKNQLTIYS